MRDYIDCNEFGVQRGARHRPAPPRLSTAQPAKAGLHGAEWLCEFVGTGLLVLGGLSAVVLNFGRGSPVASVISSHSLRLLLTGAVFASCGALVAVSPIGRRSGAHLNPAVTFAFWCRRHLHAHDLAGYVISQCAGAIAGAVAVKELWGRRATSVQDGATLPAPHVAALEAAGIEALMTGLLVATIFAMVSSPRTARWTPLAVIVAVAVLVWQGAPYTGTSLNPARSLGPAVVSGIFDNFWVYLAGPLTGALLVVVAWVLLPLETKTAKIFHDERYRSVFRSAMPARG